MDENKDFTWPEESSGIFNTESQPENPLQEQEENAPAETGETVETAKEDSGNAGEENTGIMAETDAEQKLISGTYRGRGAGRKESPFANSPYVMQQKSAEPEMFFR